MRTLEPSNSWRANRQMTDVISWKGFEDIHFSELVKQYKYFICDTNRAVFCFV